MGLFKTVKTLVLVFELRKWLGILPFRFEEGLLGDSLERGTAFSRDGEG